MKNLLFSIGVLFFVMADMAVFSQRSIDFETGVISTGYNDVRIPGNQGTFLSLKDDLKAENKLFYRVRASYTINQRHTLSLLIAPLETFSEGSVANDISFAGRVFAANTQIKGRYKFNSYRLTYRYEIVNKPKLLFGLGFTAKIRDAKIQLTSPFETAQKTSFGFVPIINFKLSWMMTEKLSLLLDGDALAAPQGRAEDVLIAANYKLSDKLDIRAGYRILEGGADNAIVYTFSMFHYASLGVTYSF